MRDIKTKKLVYAGLLTAAITVATAIKPPIPTFNGYIHFGDGMIFLAALILGPISAIAAGIGSALADVLLGYGIYAPATFFIKALMALVVVFLIKKDGKHIIWNIIVFILAELVMIGGYFCYDSILLGGFALAFAGVGFNAVQALFGVVIGIIFLPISKKIKL